MSATRFDGNEMPRERGEMGHAFRIVGTGVLFSPSFGGSCREVEARPRRA
jgi:hypothetical protein